MIPKLKLSNCIVLLLGSIIQAVGIYNIHALSNVTEGGVLGMTCCFSTGCIFPRLSAALF